MGPDAMHRVLARTSNLLTATRVSRRVALMPAIRYFDATLSKPSLGGRLPVAAQPHPSLSRRLVTKAQGDAQQKPGYYDKEKRVHDDVTSMRAEAQEYMQSILKDLNSSLAQSRGPANGLGAPGLSSEVKTKLQNAIRMMQEGLVERDTEVRLLLLAAMAGEHILLIGPPGTAKSEVGRRLNKLIRGTYFERLLTRFSVPEELFGPLSMRALEEDKYVRQTRGYLPEAEVAFIDEIFKANSAILNTLLTLINERLFDNGSQRVRVPLISVVGASNELPESEELDALYDRFLVRRQVKQVTPSGVAQMLTYYSSSNTGEEGGYSGNNGQMGMVRADMMLTRDDIRICKEEALRTVRVPPHVII
mmetsp:Transcript_40685/g.90451  ORF Transcript_40685/g.90451 Transcript_40685/m.90451 type:complete len:362 (+) Transcript_40685:81-1166(+)